MVGARVERADFEIPPSELHREMLERAPTENIRRELLEKEGKEKGYDMRLWKRVSMTSPERLQCETACDLRMQS